MLLRLFETFPDAKSLLGVEPEILAGPLLVFLEGNQDITLERIISRDSIFGPLDDDRRSRLPRDKREEIRQRYPREHDDTILFALMEAWQWLENEGFVAPRPTLSPQMGSVIGDDQTLSFPDVEQTIVTPAGRKQLSQRWIQTCLPY